MARPRRQPAKQEPKDNEHLDGESGNDELFASSIYQDPKLVYEHNGRRVDDIRLAFAGNVGLARWTHDDLELFKGLKEGDTVEWKVTAVVRKSGHTLKKPTAKLGAKLVETKTIEVHSITP
jgi:hypothetical protein